MELGGIEAAKQAFQTGADAVYVGLRGWIRDGARGEFDCEELRLWTELAHVRGKK
jgi:collagenase-like PrtC family protease